jgi:hypothetical protein
MGGAAGEEGADPDCFYACADDGFRFRVADQGVGRDQYIAFGVFDFLGGVPPAQTV